MLPDERIAILYEPWGDENHGIEARLIHGDPTSWMPPIVVAPGGVYPRLAIGGGGVAFTERGAGHHDRVHLLDWRGVFPGG